MKQTKAYVGIDKDINGGMTDTAKIIRDAWMFGLIPETEACEGWTAQGLERLWEQVNAAWEPYGFLVSNLPDDRKAAFMRIQDAALDRAKALGWDPDRDLQDET